LENILNLQFQVRTFDLAYSGRVKPRAILNFLQESAAEHAFRLGVAMDVMAQRNLVWILSRYHILFSRYPGLGRTLNVKTWPSVRSGLFTLREFDVTDNQGSVLQATTSWLALDIQKKKPVSIADMVPDFPLHSQRAINDGFDPLPVVERVEMEMEFPVLQSDLDINKHVNNVVYISWAVENVPEEILFSLRPAEIEINYRAEAFYGDRIISRTQKLADDHVYCHQLFRSRDGIELARLKTRWADI